MESDSRVQYEYCNVSDEDAKQSKTHEASHSATE